MLFADGDEYNWFDSIFHFYPQIDKEQLLPANPDGKSKILLDFFQNFYEGEKVKNEIVQKVVSYNEHWQIHRSQVEDALSDAFQYDVRKTFNDITGNITFNPICPRFLETCTFDVFYLNSERGALGISLHEVIHFVWFDIWQKHFDDSAKNYETPHLKWLFSEMVVDPIMRKDSRLSEINPYFDDGCVYPYFYKVKINGKPILETLYEMYSCQNIVSFMEQGYALCQKHEAEIRAQIK